MERKGRLKKNKTYGKCTVLYIKGRKEYARKEEERRNCYKEGKKPEKKRVNK